ncbi:hypothetical protein CEXT_481671 [Caerostris extrusa]|uniref:Uncharacterized protein n=1 Tax=Caerostris extrusa TaxID=172846 RepID=A0AAV4R1V4_CAEEX|nr:hypothetical protein CEXT_481671 [Caerostris extrusa]
MTRLRLKRYMNCWTTAFCYYGKADFNEPNQYKTPRIPLHPRIPSLNPFEYRLQKPNTTALKATNFQHLLIHRTITKPDGGNKLNRGISSVGRTKACDLNYSSYPQAYRCRIINPELLPSGPTLKGQNGWKVSQGFRQLSK